MKTNIELINELMEWDHPYGSAMKQMVIMTSIEKYCSHIMMLKQKPHDWPDIISFPAFQATAQYILEKLVNR